MKTKKTKLKLLASCFLLLATLASFAQDSIVIQGELKNNSRFAKVVLNKFGIGSFPIAAFPIQNNKFRITAPADIEPGVYRFQYSQTSNEYVDVIINGVEKNIAFILDVLDEAEKRKPIFNQSQENQNWYSYQNQSQLQLQKIASLQEALAGYPNSTDKIVTQIEKAIKLEQANYKKQEVLFIKSKVNTWAANLVQNKPVYFPNPKDDWRIHDVYRFNYYWNKIDTNNPKLINSPLYTEHILNYLKYYMNPEMHFEEEEMNLGFKKSVDTIMNRFSGNEKTKEFALKYLQLGFKEIGNEKVLQYLDEKFAANEQCTSDDEALKNRLKGYETIKGGALAPAFEFQLENGITKKLSDFANEEIVVVFWASWCPHCMQEMPKLQEWASHNKNKKVIAVSLDEDKTAYENAKKSFPNLIHTCDYKKWDGAIVKSYFISATPTVIGIGAHGKIQDKYAGIEAFLNVVK